MSGSSTLIAKAGNNAYVGAAGGSTVLDYGGSPGPVAVNLATGTAANGWGGSDALSGIAVVRGSRFADTLIAGPGGATLIGGGGGDTLRGGAGNDTLVPGAGNNTLDGGGGTNTADYSAAPGQLSINLGTGVVSSNGYGGHDSVANVRNVLGPSLASTIVGGPGGDYLRGGAGYDVITGGSGNDTIMGGAGSNVLDGGPGGFDTVDYSAAPGAIDVNLRLGQANGNGYGKQDVLSHFRGVIGTGRADLIVGDDADDYLDGGAGNDTLTGGAGNDTFVGGAGNKTISGGGGVNTLDYSGGSGALTINLATGVVSANGFGGHDAIAGITAIRAGGGAVLIDGSHSLANLAITAGSGHDIIRTGSGDDTLRGGAGSVVFSPGGGTNDITGAPGGHVVVDATGLGFRNTGRGATADGSGGHYVSFNGGVDNLRGVAEMDFADGHLTFDPADPAAAVVRLYGAALGRGPDQAGLDYWNVAIHAGQPLAALGNGFVASAEFTARYGGTSDTGYVNAIYTNVLGRGADAGGLGFWTGQLGGGASRGAVLAGISESAENLAHTAGTIAAGLWVPDAAAEAVARLYDTVLGRRPDVGGLHYWTAGIEAGTATLHDTAASFVAAPEFAGTYGALGDAAFVNLVYQNTLHRGTDAAGLAYWTGVLGAGAARADMLIGFSESAEHAALTADNIRSETPGRFGILFA